MLGARHGVRGIRDGNLIDLSALSESDLRRLADTPNAALGSTRDKPDAAYCDRILERLKEAKADAFIYIGGNDTAGTLQILEKSGGDRMAFVHAPKTIDNDLVENDHTPGFISAGLFVSHAFLSMDLDFRALPGIYVGIVMAATPASSPPPPLPGGRPRAMARIWSTCRNARSRPTVSSTTSAPRARNTAAASLPCRRGVTTADGKPLVESLIGGALERDAHGNVQLSTSDLGLAIQAALSKAFPKVRARVDTFGYLPRAFSSAVSDLDRREAHDAGAFAVAAAEKEAARSRSAAKRAPVQSARCRSPRSRARPG